MLGRGIDAVISQVSPAIADTSLTPIVWALLILGYGLRDWNLRVILRRIWSREARKFRSWAIQVNPDPLEMEIWDEHGVEIRDVRLEEYVERLSELLGAWGAAAVPA